MTIGNETTNAKGTTMTTYQSADGTIIRSSKIVVSKNSLTECGWTADHKVVARFPRCRKDKLCIVTPMHNSIWVKPLFDHNGSGDFTPEMWRRIVRESPIVSDDLQTFQIELTDELRAAVLARVESICDCPAVVN